MTGRSDLLSCYPSFDTNCTKLSTDIPPPPPPTPHVCVNTSVSDSDMTQAVLYTGRGSSHFCVTETLKVLADLSIPTTCITHIDQLAGLPEHANTLLGKCCGASFGCCKPCRRCFSSSFYCWYIQNISQLRNFNVGSKPYRYFFSAFERILKEPKIITY